MTTLFPLRLLTKKKLPVLVALSSIDTTPAWYSHQLRSYRHSAMSEVTGRV